MAPFWQPTRAFPGRLHFPYLREGSTHVGLRPRAAVLRGHGARLARPASLPLVSGRLMRKEAFLPLFFGDFLSSTIYWRGEEQALYVLLLGYQWSSGPLPTDLTKLSQVARYDHKQFLRLWETVGKKFASTAEGLVNLRLEEIREKSHEISGIRSSVGSKGGRASAASRAAKAAAKPQANVQPIASILPKQNRTIHTIPIQSEESEACQGKKSEGLQ